MKIHQTQLGILLLALFSIFAHESAGQKNSKYLVSRFLYAPNPLPYDEALKASKIWANGMSKKQIKTIKSGLNELHRPKGFQSRQEMDANQFNIGRYFIQWLTEFKINETTYFLICIPKKENSAMPAELRPMRDLYMCVTDKSVSKWRAYDPALDGFISRYYSPNEFYPGKYESCRIVNPDGILPSKLIYEHQGWIEFIHPYLKEDVVLFSKEIDRPDFLLSSEENRSTYADRFPFYTCNAIAEFYINGKKTCLVEINAFENRHMPQEMIPQQTMYLLVNDSALDRSRGWAEELDGNPEPINIKNLKTEVNEDPVQNPGMDVLIGKGEKVKCYIVDRGELYSEAGIEEFKEKLISQLINFEEVSANIVQTAWPEGIKSLERREANEAYFFDYNAYAVARVDVSDQVFYIVKIDSAENKHMPADMVPAKSIYFLFGSAGLSLEKIKYVAPEINEISEEEEPISIEANDTGDISVAPVAWKIEVVPGRKTRVYITDRGQLYSTFELKNHKSEIESFVGSAYYDVLKYGNENNWPQGISTLTNRDKNNDQFMRYSVHAVARFGEKYYVLEVDPKENEHMPADMQSDKPFYFIIGADGISAEKP